MEQKRHNYLSTGKRVASTKLKRRRKRSTCKSNKMIAEITLQTKLQTILSLILLVQIYIHNSIVVQAIDLSEKQFNLDQKVAANTNVRLQHATAAPRFALEPPSLVEYSNSTGAIVACKANIGPALGSIQSGIDSGPTILQLQDAATNILNSQPPVTLIWRLIGKEVSSASSLLNERRELEQQVEQFDGRTTAAATTTKTNNSQAKYVRHDGSLVIAPFKSADYQPEVHSGIYRCCLANQFGSLCSRPVRLKAVLDSESINLDVFDEFALVGNLVKIKCQAPTSSISRHLHAYSWFKDDKLLISQQQQVAHFGKQVGGDDYGQVSSLKSSSRSNINFISFASNSNYINSRQSNYLSPTNQKFFIQQNGDLIIRNVSKYDAANYKCKAKHKLTGVQVSSKIGGQLIIHQETTQRSELKQVATTPVVWTHENAHNFLVCAQFQSVPLASYRWFKLVAQRKIPVFASQASFDNTNTDINTNHNNEAETNNDQGDNYPLGSQFIEQVDSCLLFGQVHLQHGGVYLCEATQSYMSSDGKQRQQTTASSSIRLIVTSSQLSAQVNVVAINGQQQPQPQHSLTQVRTTNHGLSFNIQQQSPVIISQLGASIHLNCSISGQPYDTVAWFKDSQLLAVTTWPNGLFSGLAHDDYSLNRNGNGSSSLTESWLNPTFFQPRYNNQQHQQTLDRIANHVRLIQPTVIEIEKFDLKSRGVYQCQVYSSSTSLASLTSTTTTTTGTSTGNPIEKLIPGTDLLPSSNDQRYQVKMPSQYESPNLARLNHLIEYFAECDLSRSASGSLQLDVASQKPTIVQKFPSNQLMAKDSPLSLQCSASGLPIPKILWFLDDQLILDPSSPSSLKFTEELEDDFDLTIASQNFNLSNVYDPISSSLNALSDERFQINTMKPIAVMTNGMSMREHQPQLVTIVSQLNVSQVDISENGQYKCLAISSIGSSQHSGQVNVMNPQSGNGIQLRPYQVTKNFTLIAGKSATLQCPLVGFPLSKVEWFHQDHRLPVNHRQRIEPVKLGSGGQLELTNVNKEADGGIYTCRSSLNATATITAFGELSKTLIDATNHMLGEASDEDLVGQVQTMVKVAPQIDTQTLPELVVTNEGMRTKLVCSIVQGDHPIELRWLRRVTDRSRFAQVGKSRWFGFELMQNSMVRMDSVDAITVLNLDDSCQLTFKQITYLDSGEYLCVAQNEVGQTTRQTRLVVNLAPEWSRFEPPGEQSVLLGSRLQLDCQAHGHPSPVVTWKRNYANNKKQSSENSNIQAQQQDNQMQQSTFRIEEFIELTPSYRQRSFANGTLIIEQVDEQDSGAYLCEVTNGVGLGLSKVIRVKVNVPPYFKVANNVANNLAQPPTLTRLAPANGKAELKCQVYGDQPMIVGWIKGASEVIDLVRDSRQRVITENAISNQIFESTLSIKDTTRNDSSFYSCIASNEFGTEEKRIHLIIQEPPEAPILLRPIRTTSRQATISFRPPYSGNSLVKRYAIYYKSIVAGSSMESQSSSSSVASDTRAVDLTSVVSQMNNTSDELSTWQSVVVDAPSASESSVLDMTNPLPNNSDTFSAQQDFQQAQTNQLVVNLNLCCLKPFTRYLVRVRAINDLGQSLPSRVVAFVTDEEAIGGPPLDVGVEPTGAHSLKVRWRAPAKNLQNGQIRGYYIGYRANLLPGQSLNLNDKQLKLQAGSVTVLSDSFSGEGEQYQYKNIQLDPIPATQLPLGIDQFDTRSTNWPMEFLDLQQQVDASILNATSLQKQQQQLQAQIYTSYLTNLRRKTSYSVIVQAYNKIGAGPRSDQIIVSTLDAAPPMSPILRLVSVDYDSAQLVRIGREFSRFGSSIQNNNSSAKSSLAGRQGNEMSLTMFDSSDLNFDPNLLDEDDDPQSYYTINYRLEERHYGPQGGAITNLLNNPQAQAQSGLSSQQQVAPATSSDPLNENWVQKRIQKRQQMPYLLSNLRCGSYYLAYMTATNSLGQSEPGESIRFNTLGAAPIAPSDSHDFILVNSTFVVLKLDSWQNAGCLISSFVIKYKSASQSKWTILEHQVHPTIQTTTISGPSVFATRPVAIAGVSGELSGTRSNLQESGSSLNLEAQARSLFSKSNIILDQKPQQLINKRQELSDFIIRNLIPNNNYRLIVEANSESGSTIGEYEFDTSNLSSSTVSINVHGIVASDIEAQNSNNFLLNGYGNNDNKFRQLESNGDSDSSGGYFASNGQRASSNPLHRYTLGVWSLTVIFVIASIFMASATLILGLRSIIRIKNPRGNGESTGSRDNLITSLLCCSNSASSNSSNADSSHSSSGTCYQLPEHNQMSEVASNYCSLPPSGLLLSPMKSFRNRMNRDGDLDTRDLGAEGHYAPAQFRPQLVTSSSLSTIGGRYGPIAGNSATSTNGSRHTQTLSRLQHMNSDVGSPMMTQGSGNHIRAHYAATLGKQHHQLAAENHGRQFSFTGDSSQCVETNQPLKYNVSPIGPYNRYHQMEQHYLSLEAATVAASSSTLGSSVNKDNNNNTNLYNPTSGGFQNPHLQLGGSSEAGTSGYETNSYGTKTMMDESSRQVYNMQTLDAYRAMSLYDTASGSINGNNATGSSNNNSNNNNLFLQQQQQADNSQLYVQQHNLDTQANSSRIMNGGNMNVNEIVVQNQGQHNDNGFMNHQVVLDGKLMASQQQQQPQQQQSMLSAMNQLPADAYGMIFGSSGDGGLANSNLVTGSGTNGSIRDDQLHHQLNSLIQMQQHQQSSE